MPNQQGDALGEVAVQWGSRSGPAWSCMHGPAGQPADSPLPRTFTTSYNRDLVPLVVEDRSGGATRTTATTLDAKGRTTQRLRCRSTAVRGAPTSIAASTNAGTNWTNARCMQIPGLGMVSSGTGATSEWSLENLHSDTVATQANITGARGWSVRLVGSSTREAGSRQGIALLPIPSCSAARTGCANA